MNDLVPGREFPARMESLADVLAVVAGVCRRAGLDRTTQLRIELVVEEVFTNIVRHGYDEAHGHSLWAEATLDSGLVRITFQDTARAWNPLTAELPELDVPIEHRRVGGLGLKLVSKIAASVRYERVGERNVLTLAFAVPRQPSASPP